METKRRKICPGCEMRQLYKCFRYVDHNNNLIVGVLCHACVRAIPEVMIVEMQTTQLLLKKKMAILEAEQIFLETDEYGERVTPDGSH